MRAPSRLSLHRPIVEAKKVPAAPRWPPDPRRSRRSPPSTDLHRSPTQDDDYDEEDGRGPGPSGRTNGARRAPKLPSPPRVSRPIAPNPPRFSPRDETPDSPLRLTHPSHSPRVRSPVSSGSSKDSTEKDSLVGGAAGRGDGGAPVVVPESEWNATMAALFGVPPSGRKKKKPRDASAADAARRMEAAKKAAARDALRRKAERRMYKPANAWMLGKLAAMYGGFVSLVIAQLFFSALAGSRNERRLARRAPGPRVARRRVHRAAGRARDGGAPLRVPAVPARVGRTVSRSRPRAGGARRPSALSVSPLAKTRPLPCEDEEGGGGVRGRAVAHAAQRAVGGGGCHRRRGPVRGGEQRERIRVQTGHVRGLFQSHFWCETRRNHAPPGIRVRPPGARLGAERGALGGLDRAHGNGRRVEPARRGRRRVSLRQGEQAGGALPGEEAVRAPRRAGGGVPGSDAHRQRRPPRRGSLGVCVDTRDGGGGASGRVPRIDSRRVRRAAGDVARPRVLRRRPARAGTKRRARPRAPSDGDDVVRDESSGEGREVRVAGRGGSRPDDSRIRFALPPSRRGRRGELRALAPARDGRFP